MKLLVKLMVIAGICVLLFPPAVFAKNMYVTDFLKLTLRSGPSTGHKILAVVESGQSVEVLEPGEDWALVRIRNGKEGYVLTRYLVSEPTHNIRLEQLQKKHSLLMQQSAARFEENTRLKAENKKIRTALNDSEKTLKKLRLQYDKLKTGSAEFLTLKSRYQKSAAQLTTQTRRAEKLDEQLSKIEMNQYIKWFLAGSGVLLLGFIIGFSARRQRRRPSLL